MESNIGYEISSKQNFQVNSGSYFDGGLLSYIGHSFISFIITIFTLGICYPFAVVMMLEWKVKHTVVEGRRLRFEGTGIGLFGNWIKWWLLCIITIGIYSFWIVIKMEQWKAKHTYFV